MSTSDCRRASRARFQPIFALTLLPLMSAAHAAGAAALPTGASVAAGAATVSQSSASQLTVTQSSAKAIINWTGFSIGQGAAVQINNGTGATLNRVTGTSVSAIDGTLRATGSVYLLNPNGVIIGKTGVVNVGGTFVASTLNVTDVNFMAGGDLSFAGASNGAVINLGSIGALGGDVALIAAKVDNEGSITAANGTAGLISGYAVTLRDTTLDDGKFAVLLGGSDTSVTNSGIIAAANAELRAEGGNIYALAGNTAGVIRATGVKSDDGKIWLVADGGTLEVAGTLDAQGANGSAGAIETSGQTVKIDAAAINAHGGTWSLDPVDLTIDATAAATINAALANTTDVTQSTDASGTGGAGDIILNAQISWSTAANFTLSAYHDIDLNAAITSTGTGSVTLRADNAGTGSGTVVFNSGGLVTASGGGAVAILYNPAGDDNTTVNGASYVTPTDYTGYVTLSNGSTLTASMLVNTAYDLQNIQNNLTGTYALGKDIDASVIANFNPIGVVGSGETSFTGVLDGLGHNISGLTIDYSASGSNADVGLFSAISTTGVGSGVIQNLNLVGGSVTANSGSSTGALAGYMGGGTVSGVTSSVAVSGNGDTGGLIGYVDGGPGVTITNTSASGAVTSNNGVAGGLIGYADGDYGSITLTGVSATGAVSAPNADAGGLIGDAKADNGSITLSSSYATGAVSGANEVGGLIGYADGNTYAGTGLSITNSYATGAVTSTGDDAGGLIGYAYADDGSITITGSYATGAVNGLYSGGGLIGYADGFALYSGAGLTITNSYATGAATSTYGAAGGLIGYADGDAGSISVSNSSATGAATTAVNYGYAGGLIGVADGDGGSVSITGSSATGAASASGYDGYAGGLIGYAEGDGGMVNVTASFATGAANASGANGSAGGLVGFADSSNGQVILSSVYATGTATASGGSGIAGGLLGFLYAEGGGGISISNAFAMGAVSASYAEGGLIGYDNLRSGSTATIDSVYATGYLVPNSATRGGLIGSDSGVAVTNSYYDTDTTGVTFDSTNATGLTTAALQGALPAGFSNTVWSTGAGLYPYLTAFGAPNVIKTTALLADGATGAAGGTVSFYSGGALVNTVTAGANGAVYDMVSALPTGALVESLTLSGASAVTGLSYTDVLSTSGLLLTAPTVQSALFSAHTSDGSYTALGLDIAATYGLNNYIAAINGLNSVNASGAITATGDFDMDQTLTNVGSVSIAAGGQLTIDQAITSTAGNISLSGSGDITLNNDLTASTGTVSLLSGASVLQNGGIITADTLIYSDNQYGFLDDANAVANLGAVTSAYDFYFNDTQDLTLTGAITGARSGLGITTTGNLTLNQAATISNSASGGLVLTAGGDININSTLSTEVAELTAGQNGLGAGTVSFGSTGSLAAAGGATIYYNPVGGYGGPNASTTSTNPYTTSGQVTGPVTAYMLVNNLANLEQVSTNLAGLYSQTQDIDASATSGSNGGLGFIPIGNGATPFIGSYEGNSYSITGLTETPAVGTTYVGLFGAVGTAGVVQDVTLTNASITGYGYTGGLVGDLSGQISDINVIGGTVTGLSGTGGVIGVAEAGSSWNATSTTAVSGVNDVGGIVGANFATDDVSQNNGYFGGSVIATGAHVGGIVGVNYGDLDYSYLDSQDSGVTTPSVTGGSYVGGLVGLNFGSAYGYSYGTVNGTTYVGGMVGWNDAAATISGYAYGNVIGSGDYVGGFAGVNKGALSNIFADGTVTGGDYVGGLVGLNQGSISQSTSAATTTGNLYVGGLVGWNDTAGTIDQAYSTGAVTGRIGGQEVSTNNDYVGGLVGVNYGAISNVYATGAVSGVQVVGGLIGTNMPFASITGAYATGAVTASLGAAGTTFGVQAGIVTYTYGVPTYSGQLTESGYYVNNPNTSGDGVDLTPTQAISSAAYRGFDFTNIWSANDGASAPTLVNVSPDDDDNS